MASKTRATATHRPAKKRKPQAPAKTWHELFLAELRKCGNVRSACAKARIDRTAAYRARKEDDAFAGEWKSALEDAIDDLEAEAWRRAHKGNSRYVLYKGEPVQINGKYLIEREQSDSLMALLLKAHRPDKYRERADTLNLNVDWSQLTDEQLDRLSRGEDLRAVLASPGAGGTGATAPAEPERGAADVDAAPAEPPAADRL